MHAELRRETDVGAIVLGDDQQAAHVLVQPVDDARPQHAADARQAAGAVGEQGIDQGAARMARRRMDHQARRLVEHEQVLVLEHDVERARLRLRQRRPWLGQAQRVALTRFDPARSSVITASSRLTSPASIRSWRRARDSSGQRLARNLSRRWPASSGRRSRSGCGSWSAASVDNIPSALKAFVIAGGDRAGRRHDLLAVLISAARRRRRSDRAAGAAGLAAARGAGSSRWWSTAGVWFCSAPTRRADSSSPWSIR